MAEFTMEPSGALYMTAEECPEDGRGGKKVQICLPVETAEALLEMLLEARAALQPAGKPVEEEAR